MNDLELLQQQKAQATLLIQMSAEHFAGETLLAPRDEPELVDAFHSMVAELGLARTILLLAYN